MPASIVKKQAIYKCRACGHEGLALRYTKQPWRWYHYLTSLFFFPFGLWFTMTTTDPVAECAKCHSGNIKRVRYEFLPYAPVTDSDTLRNKRHRLAAGIIIVVIILLGIIGGALEEDSQSSSTVDNATTSQENTVPNPTDIVLKADYDEGWKAGYADGRSPQGQITDSYPPPATTERADSYAQGYHEGFKAGCEEGNFDCTEALRAVSGEVDASQI